MEFQRSQKLKENFETNVISDSVRRLRCSSEPRIIDSLRQCARGVATTSSSSLNIKKKISNCAETDSESCMSTKIQGSNFKVAVRVRPPLLRELRSEWPYSNVIQVDQSEHFISVNENSIGNDPDTKQPDCGMFGSHVFSFDKIYDENSDQSKVYDETGKDLVMSCLSGYNATILAYGQTGAGKTYTMEGFGTEWEGRGIIPRAIEQVFTHIEENASPYLKFMVRGSYLQIYNDVITDLLRSDKECLAIRESSKRGIYVQGLSEWVVRNPQEIYSLMERGARLRSTATTKLNKVSSRSHAIFTIIVEQTAVYYVDSKGVEFGGARGGLEEEDLFQVGSERLDESVNSAQMNSRRLRNDYQISRQTFKVGKLNLVDLAGSERVRVSGASGQRLEESRKINQSLSALGNVIGALTDSKGRQHIPYRDSKLTRILEDSLGGNCKTTMIALVSPAQESMAETLSTLKFASRAKNIRNEAMVNEDLDQKSLLRKYERELHKLRSELEERSRTVVDSRQVLRLQQERDYALKDRLKAVRELERQSQVFRKEKEEKNRLEHRIASLTSQVIRGTSATSFTGRSENQNSHSKKNTFEEKLRKEYEARIAELEKEKGTFLFEKQQADRYKQQLIKMRDIMIALTHRLTQRDEQILGLQDELDEYESKEKELEDKLDGKTVNLIQLQHIIMEHIATLNPEESKKLIEALEMNDHLSMSTKSKLKNRTITDEIVNMDCEYSSDTESLIFSGVNLSSSHSGRLKPSQNNGNLPRELKSDIFKNKLKTAKKIISGDVGNADMDTDRQQHDKWHRERRAMRSIMDKKIRILVDNVDSSVKAVISNPVNANNEAVKTLTNDVTMLQYCVLGCINALDNSEIEDSNKNSSKSEAG